MYKQLYLESKKEYVSKCSFLETKKQQGGEGRPSVAFLMNNELYNKYKDDTEGGKIMESQEDILITDFSVQKNGNYIFTKLKDTQTFLYNFRGSKNTYPYKDADYNTSLTPSERRPLKLTFLNEIPKQYTHYLLYRCNMPKNGGCKEKVLNLHGELPIEIEKK